MQVARLLEGEPTRNATGKVRQMLMAEKIEERFSKDQILTFYLMLAPYGGNIEGVRAASLAYFGKEPTRLTVAEAALLVALPQSPEARRPDRDADRRAGRARPRARPAGRGGRRRRGRGAGGEDRKGADGAPGQFPMLAAHLAAQAVAANPGQAMHRLTIDRDLQQSLEALARDRAAALGPKLSIADGGRRSPTAGRSSPRSDRPASSRTSAPVMST